MKNVLITGATGMIGIALTKHLTALGISVTAVCRSSSNAAVFAGNRLVTLVECDISNLLSLATKLEHNYDCVFHLAWSGTAAGERDNMHLQNQNVRYALDALELAAALGCTAFLGAGSQAEYGRVDGKIAPKTPCNPENGYGIAKLCAGQMTRIYAAELGIKHIWVRILSVFGEHDKEYTMVMSALRAFLAGESPAFTKGEQLWDYIYCADAAKALYLAALNGVNGSVYCIGSGEARPMKDYITAMRDAVNPALKLRLGEREYNKNQVMYLCADITNLKSDTGFKLDYTFEQGVAKTLKWCTGEEV